MSSFNCEECGTPCHDTAFGYVSGCEHHPADPQAVARYLRNQLVLLNANVVALIRLADGVKSPMLQPLKQWRDDLMTSILLLPVERGEKT